MRHDSPSEPLSRRQRKARATRAALFEAGLTAFDRQPLGLVSVLDITEAADVAKGVFYLHFKSKDEYLLAILEHLQLQLLERMNAAVESTRGRTRRLGALIRAYHGAASDDPRGAHFMLRMSSYTRDEIGPPGRLHELRAAFVRRVAALLTGRGESAVDARTLRIAERVDALSWALLWESMRQRRPLPDCESMVLIVSAAARQNDTLPDDQSAALA